MRTFGFSSTTDDVLEGIDLSNKRYVVTGASGGIGVETARALAAHGAEVVMAARDDAKNEAAAAAIVAAHPSARVSTGHVDLSSLASVREFTDSLVADGRPLSGIVANAGVMATPAGRTVDGFETQFGTNHLGHFVLVGRLLPLVVAGAPGRVVMLSSAAHARGDVNMGDVNFEDRPYDPFEAYGASKTSNVLHAVGIDARFAKRGVRAFAVHPGGIRTELGRYMGEAELKRLGAMVAAAGTGAAPFQFKSVEQGAATSVWALTAPELDGRGGVYCEDCHVAPVRRGADEPTAASASPSDGGVMRYAIDPLRANELWALSQRLTGDIFR
jgi:NAD(P)-dependent dehydrogenase (short-subunit alcohol dehydrogenase family)